MSISNKVLPNKKYFTIGEVAKLCNLPPHVLRYWEGEFKDLNPIKRRGNRRYYQRHEVHLIFKIQKLLHVKGYTIEGARQFLSNNDGQEKHNQSNIVPLILEDLYELKSILENNDDGA